MEESGEFITQNCEKMSADDLTLLLEFYRDNAILWNASHPQYRSHIEKAKAKEELVKSLGCRFPIELLEKKFHSLGTSMRREVKRQLQKNNDEQEPAAKRPKRPWVHYETMIFMKEEIERGRLYCSIINTC